LAGIGLLLAFGQAPALVAPITVSGTSTLVSAINLANRDTAIGDCMKGASIDRIVLPATCAQAEGGQKITYYVAMLRRRDVIALFTMPDSDSTE
jgi:hypothetical protein